MKRGSIKKSYFAIFLIATVVGLFGACEKDRSIITDNTDPSTVDTADKTIPVDTTKNGAKIHKIDITNAKVLFISSAYDNSRSGTRSKMRTSDDGGGDEAVLYKVLENDSIIEVRGIDENGDTVSFHPKYIYSIPNTPFVFCAIVSYWDIDREYNQCFLVNKENGTVQDVSYIDLVTFNDVLQGARYIQTDNHGMIYILNRGGLGGQIYRLNASNSDNVIGTCITSSATEVYEYIVNGEGVLYSEDCTTLPSDSSFCGAHIYTLDGRRYFFDTGTEGIDGIEDFCTVFVGLDGKLHVWNSYTIRVLDTDNNDFRIDTIWRYKKEEGRTFEYFSGGYAYDVCAYTQGRILYASFYGKVTIVDSEDPKEIGRKTFEVYPFDVYDQRYIVKIGSTKQYLYCAVSTYQPDKHVELDKWGFYCSQYIYRVDVSGHTFQSELYFDNPDYDIYDMTILENEEIIFCGRRVADGVEILASIDANGNFHILEENIKLTASKLYHL